LSDRIGHDAFGSSSSLRWHVTFDRDTAGWRATLGVHDVSGEDLGERRLVASGKTCRSLTDTAVFSMVVALAAYEQPSPASQPTSAPVEKSRRPLFVPESSLTVAAQRPAAWLALGVAGTLGMVAEPNVGGFVAGEARWQRVITFAELRAHLPVVEQTTTAAFRSWLAYGDAGVCFRLSWFCLGGSLALGALSSNTVGSRLPAVTSLWVATGPRLALDIPLGARWLIAVRADALVPLRRVSVSIDGRDVWTASLFEGVASLGVGVRFL
jgi:hypothetical protein